MSEISIYGKLVGRTSEGVLVGASQVYDEAQGKDQRTINGLLAAGASAASLLAGRVSSLEGTSTTAPRSVINLNEGGRSTTYMLESAIAAISAPVYGAILIFLDPDGRWQMWQYSGRDHTSAGDWSPLGMFESGGEEPPAVEEPAATCYSSGLWLSDKAWSGGYTWKNN